mgnify:FL=1
MAATEIGGYLELEDCGGKPYHEGSIALDSARSCLAYLIELRCIHSIALPDLMCSAVATACDRSGCIRRTYEVGSDFLPIYNFILADDEWLYLSDYYGTLTPRAVDDALVFANGRVIVDEVQAFFRKAWPDADTIYTCRKFFGVPDGAYLTTHDGATLDRQLPICHSLSRMHHVVGRAEDGASDHYAEYSAAEELIGAEGPKAMSEVTRRLLSGVDFGRVKSLRERNFAVLAKILGPKNQLSINTPDGPYMYPFLTSCANNARSRLARRKIYVPTLWPNVLEECAEETVARRYAEEILPLPIDQRYDEKDMRALAEAVLEEIGS